MPPTFDAVEERDNTGVNPFGFSSLLHTFPGHPILGATSSGNLMGDMQTTGQALAGRIEQTARDLRLTRKTVLRVCGVHWSTFARWRLGETEPKESTESQVDTALREIRSA